MPAPVTALDGRGAPARYGRVAIALHWLIAAALLAMLALGYSMTELPVSPLRLRLTNWHKWAGVAILALAVLRLVWRLTHRPPPEIAMAAWQRRSALVVQWLMMLLTILVPLVGWAYSSAAGFPVVFLGIVPLADWVLPERAVAETIKPWHAALAYLLGGLALVHAAAALKHQWIDRDGLWGRMWPPWR